MPPGDEGEAPDREMPPEKGVMGSLPSRRPSVESPRRAQAREAARAGSETRGTPHPAPVPEQSASALEDLARAGAGLATGTAAASLKLAGRALGGLGRVVGRG